ncbi:MAG: hypothetical protein COB24_11850 [Hyphomicrobiales bacterium]|nr:MAG: hypothetical protein COB24_11850 [Hyphomicrobiales bacterium]
MDDDLIGRVADGSICQTILPVRHDVNASCVGKPLDIKFSNDQHVGGLKIKSVRIVRISRLEITLDGVVLMHGRPFTVATKHKFDMPFAEACGYEDVFSLSADIYEKYPPMFFSEFIGRVVEWQHIQDKNEVAA